MGSKYVLERRRLRRVRQHDGRNDRDRLRRRAQNIVFVDQRHCRAAVLLLRCGLLCRAGHGTVLGADRALPECRADAAKPRVAEYHRGNARQRAPDRQ